MPSWAKPAGPARLGQERGFERRALRQSFRTAGGPLLADRSLKTIYGAPGEAWRFQRVRIPHRQGDSHPTGNRALGLWR